MNAEEVEQLKINLATRWMDPANRVEDIFRVRTSRGKVIPMVLPEPHKNILRDGILGKARELVDKGLRFNSVINKGRQIGFSTLFAAEAILTAEDFPNTNIYYIADDMSQTADFLDKVKQLAHDANFYPKELGGGPIINGQDLTKTFEKTINGSHIVGLSGRAKSGKRGKNAISVYWDEAAWCISVHNEQEEIWDTILHFTKQGGQTRIGSTPRTTDDKFWNFYSKSDEWGMKSYYRPTIENWKELDLKSPLYIDLNNERRKMFQYPILTDEEKQKYIDSYKDNPRYVIDKVEEKIYQKNVIIPYPWVKLEELEKERTDYEKFLQENLGISVDEKWKLIPSEWIYRNVYASKGWSDRKRSKNPFYMLVDIARVHDVTAISIVEKCEGDICYERMLYQTQEHYDVQVEEMWDLFCKFKPQKISIDNTGHGIVIGDLLEKKLRINGYPPSTLNRVNFGTGTKEVMAEGFKSLVQMDRYKFLNATKLHQESIRHVERVEREILPTHVRYSGKKWGRDDFFWSKAQIVYFTNMYMPSPKQSFGKVKISNIMGYTAPDVNNIVKDNSITQIREENIKKDKEDTDVWRLLKMKNIGKAIKELTAGLVDCPKTGKEEKPVFCTGCDREDCMYYDSMKKLCELAHVKPKEIWEKQKEYEVVVNETKNDDRKINP